MKNRSLQVNFIEGINSPNPSNCCSSKMPVYFYDHFVQAIETTFKPSRGALERFPLDHLLNAYQKSASE